MAKTIRKLSKVGKATVSEKAESTENKAEFNWIGWRLGLGVIAIVILFFSWVSRDSVWIEEVTVTSNRPGSYYTIDSDGHCDSSWWLYFLGLSRDSEDLRYFKWGSVPGGGWKDSHLKIINARNPNQTWEKKPGANVPSLPGKVDLVLLSGPNRTIKIQCECKNL